jgi:hypothetical protein
VARAPQKVLVIEPHPHVIPAGIAGVIVDHPKGRLEQNRAATHNELVQFVRAADADGAPSLGAAAMVVLYWLVREEDIFERFA